jgi:hypothetical protein
MDLREVALTFFKTHFAILSVCSIWHFCYYAWNDKLQYSLGGVAISFPCNIALYIGITLLNYSGHLCMWIPSICVIGFGFLVSWLFVVSLHHWTVVVFILWFLFLPPLVIFMSWKKTNLANLSDTVKQKTE